MILKFIITFFMALFTTFAILNRVTAMTKFMKGQYERKSEYLASIIVILLMCVSIALYLTLY